MIKKLLYVLIICAVMVFGLIFVLDNQTLVTVNWKGDQPWGFKQEQPLSLVLITTFIAGAAVGAIFSLLTNLRLRRQLFSSNRKLKKVDVV